MQNTKVKDLMIPLEDYATVSQEATLFEAVLALDEKVGAVSSGTYPHRGVLALNEDGHVVGKLSMLDVIRGLEPSYQKISNERTSAGRFGFSARFLKLLADDYRLWDRPLENICKLAQEVKVKDIMYAPKTEGEYVHEETSLSEAVHQIVMGHHQSLLVIRRGRITGILRLTDLFSKLADTMKACEI